MHYCHHVGELPAFWADLFINWCEPCQCWTIAVTECRQDAESDPTVVWSTHSHGGPFDDHRDLRDAATRLLQQMIMRPGAPWDPRIRGTEV